jgi:hypothetical protein
VSRRWDNREAPDEGLQGFIRNIIATPVQLDNLRETAAAIDGPPAGQVDVARFRLLRELDR